MEQTTLQPNTVRALRHFFSIWKQDPASRYILGISNSNALLWNNDQPEQYIDITPPIPASNEIDELIGTLDTPETLTLSQPNDASLLSRLKEDLNQILQPQEVSHTNPYAAPIGKPKLIEF